ncbi:hypothetical protein H0H87_004907 [Tephrocybe sp. NHM501043]|nr:hypothetical protein H0H87_004907 [Tephrocybe sp. NHM501043]
MISFHVHESATKAPRLPNRIISEGTVDGFYCKFLEEGWLTKAAQEKKEIELRLVCNESDLYYNVNDPDTGSEVSNVSFKLPISQVPSLIRSSKRKLSNASAAVTSGRESVSGGRIVRRSAWPAALKPKATFTWDIEMVQCKFRRTTAAIDTNKPVVSFTPSTETEVIEIAKTWHDGWIKSEVRQDFDGTGYIGSGSAKRVIYARFDGREYALGQGKEGFDNSANKSMLQAEFENLVQGEALRNDFEELALEMEVVIPKFSFNLEQAILGTFVLGNEGDLMPGTASLPYLDFIATPLLPCGTIDAPIKKFTGNDNTGPAPIAGDRMTMALHAFTHFTILCSRSNFVLCDLQGMCNKNGVMTLIDPQSHS